MTQAIDTSEILKQLDKIGTAVEGIQSDMTDIKLSQARTDERLKNLEAQIPELKKQLVDTRSDLKADIADIKKQSADTRSDLKADITDIKKQSADTRSDFKADITDIKTQLRLQDNRLWGFVAAVFLTVFGFLAKLAFFSVDRV